MGVLKSLYVLCRLLLKVLLNLNCLDKKIFWARKSLKSFCHFNARNLFLECYTFCGKQKDINKHQGNISSIHIYDTWECRTSKNTRKSKFRNQFDQKIHSDFVKHIFLVLDIIYS